MAYLRPCPCGYVDRSCFVFLPLFFISCHATLRHYSTDCYFLRSILAPIFYSALYCGMCKKCIRQLRHVCISAFASRNFPPNDVVGCFNYVRNCPPHLAYVFSCSDIRHAFVWRNRMGILQVPPCRSYYGHVFVAHTSWLCVLMHSRVVLLCEFPGVGL